MKINRFLGRRGTIKPEYKNRFAGFSAFLFLVILIVGSAAFGLSMRGIARENKSVELERLLETAQIRLEGMVNAEISMVLKMAQSPVIIRHFQNPAEAGGMALLTEEIDSYRGFFFDGYSIFWVNDTDRIFYMDGAEPYRLDASRPENYWYYMTMHETDGYNFNINYNPDVQALNLWINAPVVDNGGTPLGILGIGVELSSFIDRVYAGLDGRAEVYFFNAAGEVTGAGDIEPVREKTGINELTAAWGIDVSAEKSGIQNGETRTFNGSRGKAAISTVPLLDWYMAAFIADSIGDYLTPMTVLFLVVLLVISLIFVIFNIFIAKFIKSLHENMMSLEAASNIKSAFMTNMSHEIRTPLNAILGAAEIMLQNNALTAETENGLDKIHDSCALLLGIVNDILDFTKLDSEAMEITEAQYVTEHMLGDVIRYNILKYGAKPIKFEVDVDGGVPLQLIGDSLRVKQILNNLLSNAFKYTESGTVQLKVGTDGGNGSPHTALFIGVKDTGRGMTAEQLEKIYDAFSRFGGANIYSSIQGTGLGLTITQKLLNLMDGTIEIHSEPFLGSLFTVRIPQQAADNCTIGADTAQNLRRQAENTVKVSRKPKLNREPMPYGKVLVVDDMETNLYVAKGLLKLYKLKIDTAASGPEAISKINAGKTYDIIFMDHMMPEMDGIETVKRLRAAGYGGTVVALTANAAAGQADMFIHNGFDDFMAKPIDVHLLDATLTKYIRGKRPPETKTPPPPQKNAPADSVTCKKLLASFAADAESVLPQLDNIINGTKSLLSAEVLRQFAAAAHGITGSLHNIGKKSLSDIANELEKAGKRGDISMIKSELPEFTDNLKGLLGDVRSQLASDENEIVCESAEDVQEIRESLSSIQQLCADYDRKGALDVIAAITQCSAATKQILTKIDELVRHSEFEEAESMVKEYLDTALTDTPAASGKLTYVTVDGLDVARGLERFGNDEETYIRLLRSYIGSVRKILDEIADVTEETLPSYKIRVHGVKGASYDIFAQNVGQLAEALEKASAANDFAFVSEHNAPFMHAAAALMDRLDALILSVSTDDNKPVKDKPDETLLRALCDACDSFNMNKVEAAMSEIDKYRYEDDDGLTEWLKDNVALVNYGEIAAKLSGGVLNG